MPKRTKGNFDQVLAPMLFLLPNMLIFLIFIIIPAFKGLRMSFFEWGIFSQPIFIGFDNFIEMFNDTVFIRTFNNTLVYSVFTVPGLLIASLAIALMLKKNSMCGVSVYRALFYVPSLLSMITVGIAWRFLLGDELGVVNYLIRANEGQAIDWLTNGSMAMLSVIVVSVWAGAGYYMVIMIAGLQAIPQELYEAATIDGANHVDVFRRITIPLLRSTLLVTFVLATISSFKAYELISVMTQGGPGYATKLIVQQVYQVAFLEDRLGFASAMSIVLMLLISIFTLLQFKLTGKEQDYE